MTAPTLAEKTHTELTLVPIALRADVLAHVRIPVDLTPEEADKIARVVKAYAKSTVPQAGERG